MIKKDIRKNFTYGFEIEGRFNKTLCRKVRNNYRARCKSDGSVDVDVEDFGDYESCLWDGEELAIGIFDKFDEMIEVLKWFKNDKNYLQNDTCGIHVHIKPKERKINNLMRCVIGDYDFIQDSQRFAENHLCDEVKHRLSTSSFCRPYKTFSTALHDWRRKKKYAFIGNHPSNTFEFRFFSTCRHKASNIELFFDYFFRELAKIEPKKSEELTVKALKTTKIDINNTIMRGNKGILSQKYTIHHFPSRMEL